MLLSLEQRQVFLITALLIKMVLGKVNRELNIKFIWDYGGVGAFVLQSLYRMDKFWEVLIKVHLVNYQKMMGIDESYKKYVEKKILRN